ncbi:unnamed protein product [Cunninghamella blakesleeana]
MQRIEWKSPRVKRLIISYLYDWILVIIMAGSFFALDKAFGFRREFSVTDKTIMFTHTDIEEIPVWLLGVLSFLVPFVIIAAISLGYKRSIHDFHSGVLGLCLSLSISIIFTQAVKITVGRPRPDFLDRCQPPPGTVDPPYGLSNYTICTIPYDSYLMKDGFRSFPSGHSSFSFAGLAYLSLYFAGKLRLFDERGLTYKSFIFITPLLGALLVAITRTRDYRHHWQDVTVGALLGIACAYFAYRQYYPALGHLTCHHPFPLRFNSNDGVLPLTNQSIDDHYNHPHSNRNNNNNNIHHHDDNINNRQGENDYFYVDHRESESQLLNQNGASHNNNNNNNNELRTLYDNHNAQQKIQLQETCHLA